MGKPNILTDLDLGFSGGNGEIYLNNLNFGLVHIHQSGGEVNTILSENNNILDRIDFVISGGKSYLRVPKENGIKIVYSNNGGQLNVGNKKLNGEGEYLTDDYDGSKLKVKITISLTNGYLSIDRR